MLETMKDSIWGTFSLFSRGEIRIRIGLEVLL